MHLQFTAEELAFQNEVRTWIAANMPKEVAEPRLARAADPVAEDPRRQGLADTELAQGTWRAGLELDAEVHFRDGDGARRFSLSIVLQP
jgi:hypothetical protein